MSVSHAFNQNSNVTFVTYVNIGKELTSEIRKIRHKQGCTLSLDIIGRKLHHQVGSFIQLYNNFVHSWGEKHPETTKTIIR